MKSSKRWWKSLVNFIRTKRKLQKHSPLLNSVSVRLTKYQLSPSSRISFQDTLRNYVFSCLKTAGNVMTEAYDEQGDLGVMWVIERWETESQNKANGESYAAKYLTEACAKALVFSIETILAIDIRPCSMELFGLGARALDQPLTIMLFAEIREEKLAEFKAIYEKAVPIFCDEPGVMMYQLSQMTNNPTTFITYEKYRSQEAYQMHLKSAEMKPILQLLQSSVQNPPFERGLHYLIEFAPCFKER